MLILAGTGLAGLAALNVWLSWRVGALASPLDGEPRFFHWRRGFEVFNVFYSKDERGAGPPIVFLHGIDAAASSAEWRDAFAGLKGKRPLYALDLLGFGLSDRSSRRYRAADYPELLGDFLDEVVREPAVVVASSLGASYAITVAARTPERVAGLLLVSPTGLQRFNQPPTRAQRLLETFLRLPILGSAAFNLLVSRASVTYFLKERTYANPERVTDATIDYAYQSAHQDGARYAPAAFIGGSLDQDLRSIYPALTQPIWIAWGREAQVTPVSDANQFLRERPGSRLKVFDRAGLLPHVERAGEFLLYVEQMLNELEKEVEKQRG